MGITKMSFDVKISELNADGNAISNDGVTVVPGGLPGETLSVLPFARRHKRTYSRIEKKQESS